MDAAASTLTRSFSVSPRARTASFPSHHHCPPRGLPLRRALSDITTFTTRSAVLLHHSPISPVLEAPDDNAIKSSSPAGLLDGAGAGRNGGGGGGGGRGGGEGGSDGGGGCGMDEYYRRVLRVDPDNPLLLRNYGTYLHEVERDLAGAEACYARALLASPADADLLSLYGRVIWEARQEKERAAGYFERAVQAAPDDCYVLGSYASFMWDAEDEEDDDEKAGAPTELQKDGTVARGAQPAMVPAR